MSDLRSTDRLTARQAFHVMRAFLEKYWRETGQPEDVGGILSETDDELWGNGQTNDPAAWDDWLECILDVLVGRTPEIERLTKETVTPAHFVGTDRFGSDWYAQLLDDGRQFWVSTFHPPQTPPDERSIGCVGINTIPQALDPQTGLTGPENP